MLIQNGTVVTPQGCIRADILVKDGVIAAVTEPGFAATDDPEHTFDATGLHILPGVIDPHVHFREPGHTHKEDWDHGSAAAVAGGFTTVYDMPNNLPRTEGIPELEEKLAVIGKRSRVDFSLYGIVREDNAEKLLPLVKAGVRGFKGLMGISSMNTPTASDGALWNALSILKDTGCPISVHAEDTTVASIAKARLMAAGREDPRAHMESRPVIAEILAVTRAIMLAEDTGGRIHIAHIAAAKSVEIIRAAKARGVRVSCETGPHNLVFTDADYERIGPPMFMNPPVRPLADQEALFAGILDGTVDMIATDHAPHSHEDKFGGKSIWKSTSGCCGLESSVPVMLTLVNRGRLSLEQYAAVASENVAKLFNLYPRKGRIAVGSDADFTVVDLNKEGVIRSENLHSKTKVTAFDGFAYKGAPVATVIRGEFAMRNGDLAQTPFGRRV